MNAIHVMSSQRHISSRVKRRLGKRLREAFTFLVATAWSELFSDLFTMIAGDSTHIGMRLLHALMFTLLAVAVTLLFESSDEEHED